MTNDILHQINFFLLPLLHVGQCEYSIMHLDWRPTYGYFYVCAVGNWLKVLVYWPLIKAYYGICANVLLQQSKSPKMMYTLAVANSVSLRYLYTWNWVWGIFIPENCGHVILQVKLQYLHKSLSAYSDVKTPLREVYYVSNLIYIYNGILDLKVIN